MPLEEQRVVYTGETSSCDSDHRRTRKENDGEKAEQFGGVLYSCPKTLVGSDVWLGGDLSLPLS